MFENTRVGAFFLLEHAVLGGKANERHGFFAPDLSVHGTMIWRDVSLEIGAFVDLSGANVGTLFDEERSWPPHRASSPLHPRNAFVQLAFLFGT
jgi:hypothetical protein